jgi:hypothetical protein
MTKLMTERRPVHVLRHAFTLDRHRDIAVARQVGKAVVGRTPILGKVET